MDLFDHVDAYLAHLEIDAPVSTVRTRRCILGRFVRWAEGYGVQHANEVSRSTLEAYQRHLFGERRAGGKPLSRSYQNQLVGTVSVFFGWLVSEGHALHNPAKDLDKARVEHILPDVLTPDEVDKVLDGLDIATPQGVRDRAIIEVLWSSAIRREELHRLRQKDVDPQRGTLFIQGKGGHQRTVPVGEQALSWISKYKTEVRPLWAKKSIRALFISHHGNPVSTRWISHLCAEALRNAGIEKKGATHIFRHSCATALLENGVDIRLIQALLGHGHLETTQLYLRVTIKKLQEVHAKTHPARSRRKP